MDRTRLSDPELMVRIADGDGESLRTLHDRHAPWVLARLRRRCWNDDVAFDALQDTFVAVWRSAVSWNGSGEPAAWIWGIAARRLIGVERGRRRWEPPTPAVDDTSVGDDDDRVVERMRMASAVESLDVDLRHVIEAAYVDDLSVEESSVRFAVPAGTVKSRLKRARDRLREELT
ncbi:MAG: RNA polymerase sigma factor [Acidimicrobiales bacterium]|nr:MAG: RNA polymerase sigma factor [Acidimicrobiales bacterium]